MPVGGADRTRRGSLPRIGLDLTLLRPERMTGVERYAQNLALALLEAEDAGFDFVRSPTTSTRG